MSQPFAVASASFARSSPRCQLWTSLPRLPSGFSRLWSGPATKPSSESDMWQGGAGIGVLLGIAVCKRRHAPAREQPRHELQDPPPRMRGLRIVTMDYAASDPDAHAQEGRGNG